MSELSLTELEERLAAVTPGDTRARVDALVDLAWVLRLNNARRGFAVATEARELAIRTGYKAGQARAARTLAMTLPDIQGIREIFALSMEAKTLFDELGDRDGSAGARDWLSTLYEFLGDLPTALELALDALAIAQEVGDERRQGFALSSIGGILAASGEKEAGYAKLREGLTLFEKADHSLGIGTICSRLTTLCRDMGKTDEALHFAKRCLEIGDRSNNGYQRAAAYTALGELIKDRGESAEAERYFRLALEAYSNTGAGPFASAVHVSLGGVLAHRGAFEEAEAELQTALAGMLELGANPADEASAHEALADLSERRKDLPATVEHLRAAQRARERAALAETRNQLTQVEIRAEMKAAKKDAEAQRLRLAELQEMQAKLVEAEKTALLGTLAAGTAHELNSPLGVLRSNLDVSVKAARQLSALTEADAGLHSRVTRLVNILESCQATSEDAVSRIASVAERFRRFTQLDLSERRRFNVSEGLEDTLGLLAPTVPARIQLQRDISPVPDTLAWPRELNQAFMTLLLNATQAIDGAGVVTARAAVEEEQIVVRIEDTGRGMPEAELARLFDVAWSVDGPRTKMRLGLASAYAAVQRHDGQVSVESFVGQGTKVTIRLPLSRDTLPAT